MDVANVVCFQCGTQRFILVESEAREYDELPRDTAFTPYKKINHLNEILARLRVEESRKERLQHLFTQLLPAFNKFKPANRKNFISYTYVVYKLCQKVGYCDLLPHLKMLKREKLVPLELLWRKMCEYLNWEFVALF